MSFSFAFVHIPSSSRSKIPILLPFYIRRPEWLPLLLMLYNWIIHVTIDHLLTIGQELLCRWVTISPSTGTQLIISLPRLSFATILHSPLWWPPCLFIIARHYRQHTRLRQAFLDDFSGRLVVSESGRLVGAFVGSGYNMHLLDPSACPRSLPTVILMLLDLCTSLTGRDDRIWPAIFKYASCLQE